MDPFTQRMLERARARREKLDSQLSNAGHDIKKRRSPLKDANAILEQATVTKNKSPIKLSIKATTENISPAKPERKSILCKSTVGDNNEQINKENGGTGICNVKSKLQRLGKLYSDDSRELSSPIHRTEEKFNAEEVDAEHKPIKKGARLDRLAALASTINNWEDDMSHPIITKPPDNKAEKIQAKFNEQVKNVCDPQPSTSGFNKWKTTSSNNTSPVKQLKWDKAILETLASTAVSSAPVDKQNGARLQENSSHSITKASPKKGLEENALSPRSISSTKVCNDGIRKTPEKVHKNSNPGSNTFRVTSRCAFNGSPKSSIQSPGSVLSKASMFESKHTETKAKDPAQMSLSERMALFERNKEGPLIPKAPLTMSIPPKKLQEKDKSNTSPYQNGDTVMGNIRSKVDMCSKTVGAQRAIFEQGGHMQELENTILRNTYIERQRELDMLRSRFNRNKESAQVAAGSCIRTSESSEGKSNSPKSSLICPVKPTPAADTIAPPPPPPLPQTLNSNQGTNFQQSKCSPAKRQGTCGMQKAPENKVVYDVKRIRVSPPKPGNLYPNLSDIENSTETETEYTVKSTEAETATLDENTDTETGTEADYYVQSAGTESESDEESEDVNTSLGRSILRAVNQQAILKKKRSIDPDPDSTTSDISVLDEMDEYLDECLAKQEGHLKNAVGEEGPTPPKLNKGGKSPSAASTSFKYSQGSPYRSPIKVISPPITPHRDELYVVEGDNCMPLMHSVSFYRRQQSQTPKTPARVISRNVNNADKEFDSVKSNGKEEAELVEGKIKQLLDEVCKQQTIIGQASQALNLCSSTVEFNGSREQVEGERLLLVATHRRQAALNEVQRLKIEGTLRPVVPGSSEIQESGSLTVSAIKLPLKREYFRSIDTNTCLHFLCIMRHLEEIVATPVVVTEPGDSCICFPSTMKLHGLYSDFKITVEVYTLQTQAEILPHEIKYHIHSNGNGCNSSSNSSNKKLANKTPKKFLKQDSRLVMPSIQSPAGPSAVRSPAFQLAGYVIFSLKEVHRQQFTLNKVPRQSPLEGRLQMHVTCELSVSVEHRGFLTMFEDVSGFGAWHRRWCLLKGATLSYWKYPDDERKKTPIGSLDLQGVCTVNVGLVSRDICARPNTFLLETVRPAHSGDTDSLVMIKHGTETTIRHLLSADTKEDRLEWCSKLNKTLNLIRAWGGAGGLS